LHKNVKKKKKNYILQQEEKKFGLVHNSIVRNNYSFDFYYKF